ncbi:hypothetical protein MPSEU_001065700 [Mayamaea pseudoterrestris]|nr:hypothetical protein MPSEU_001065700 [Mayamaea pseudoterrestris]
MSKTYQSPRSRRRFRRLGTLLCLCCSRFESIYASPSPFFLSLGPIEDAQCNVEDLEEANDSQLYSILRDITKTNYFKTFQVDLNRKCPLASWAPETKHGDDADEADDEFECSGGAEELDIDAEPLCTVTPDDSNPFGGGGGTFTSQQSLESNALYSLSRAGFDSQQQKDTFSWQKHSDTVVKKKVDTPHHTVPLLTKHVPQSTFDDPTDDSSCEGLPDDFWLDMCHQHEDDSPTTIDLTLNPERNTGYNGTHIWRAIYEENCMADSLAIMNGSGSRESVDSSTCIEQRVLYKLLSAMHSATTISIAMHYYPPSKRKQRTDWEANPEFFMQNFKDSPDYIRNLHFTYVVLLRALHKAAPLLRQPDLIRTGNIVQDETATVLLHRLLDSSILESCNSVFAAFDESIMFQDKTDAPELQRTFKGVFHNISSILDCVQCQQCKLHGKLHMMGYGTALKLLFSKELMRSTSTSLTGEVTEWLTRNEIVALINTIAKVSEAIRDVRTLTRLYVKNDSGADVTVGPTLRSGAAPGRALNATNTILSSSAMSELEAVDQVVGLVAELGRQGLLVLDQETQLVQHALQRNTALMILCKHYGQDPDKFIHMLVQTDILNDVNGSSKDDEPDVIVIGSGLAGLTVALNVLDRGGRVVVIEKEHLLGGNSNKASSGINACCPNNDTDTAVDTREAFWNDTLKSAGSSAHPDLIEVLINNSETAVTWLKERVGVDLSLVAQLGGHSAKRTHRPSNGMAGAEIIYGLQKAIKEYEKSGNLNILLDTKVTGIVVNDNGRVSGVKVASMRSNEMARELRAANVVLATGGFAADRSAGSFLEKYRPELLRMPTTAGDFSTGDGISLAASLGAAVVDMDKIQVHPTGWVDPANPNATTKVLAAELMRGVGGILLNEYGSRFCNELGTRSYITKQMLAHNANFAQSGKWDPEATVPTFFLVLSSSAALDGKKHVDLYTHKGLLTRVTGVGELANHTGLSKSTILSTLKAYQADAKQGNDSFGKVSFRGAPSDDLDKETFYVGRVTPVLHYCMGGITIDRDGNVLKGNGDSIPGLHAVGEVTGGVHGVNRLGGNSLLECTVFGTIVGTKLPVRSSTILPTSFIQPDRTASKQATRNVPLSELEQHCTPDDCWVAIHGDVYDLTEFAEEHPAGPLSILELAGKDGSDAFASVHNKNMLDDFADDRIGKLIA